MFIPSGPWLAGRLGTIADCIRRLVVSTGLAYTGGGDVAKGGLGLVTECLLLITALVVTFDHVEHFRESLTVLENKVEDDRAKVTYPGYAVAWISGGHLFPDEKIGFHAL